MGRRTSGERGVPSINELWKKQEVQSLEQPAVACLQESQCVKAETNVQRLSDRAVSFSFRPEMTIESCIALLTSDVYCSLPFLAVLYFKRYKVSLFQGVTKSGRLHVTLVKENFLSPLCSDEPVSF
jgi:hypothetical protein